MKYDNARARSGSCAKRNPVKTDKPVSALSEELGACVKIKKKEERGKNEEKQKKKINGKKWNTSVTFIR